MIPKIVFKYSYIYDLHWKKWVKIYKNDLDYPSSRKILNYIKKIEPIWKKEESKVLKELSKIIHLKWKTNRITCYVVGKSLDFSDPLTMHISRPADYFVDILIHELIHELLGQNDCIRQRKMWNYFKIKYKTGSKNTRYHLPVHAIHAHIFMKFYGKIRLQREIKDASADPEYKKSWDIVQKEGYQKIINEFTQRLDKSLIPDKP